MLTSCEQVITAFQKIDEQKKEKKIISNKKISISYPQIYRDTTIVDDYHGKKVSDSYRWLENKQSVATQNWVNQQDHITTNYLQQIPSNQALKQRLEKATQYERFELPFKVDDKYYFFKNNGLQAQDVLYTQDLASDEVEVVLDPNSFSDDDSLILGEIAFSADGSLLAYQISKKDSPWSSIFIKDMYSMKNLEEEIEWVKTTNISWFRDGFYYSRYPEPNAQDSLTISSQFQQVYYHKAGTPQSDDELIFADRAHPDYKFQASTTSDERFLIINVDAQERGNVIYFKRLSSEEAGFVPLDESFRYKYKVIDSYGNFLLVLTNYNAPNGRLVRVWTSQAEKGYWENLVPESQDILTDIHLSNGKIVATYHHNASSHLEVFDMSGYWYETIELPAIGQVSNMSAAKKSSRLFYEFSSFMQPPTIYQVDMTEDTLRSRVFKMPKLDFNPADYVTKQLWYHSYDGEKIPMFVTHKKGLKMDGQRPTLLYGYGGFEVSILPSFNLTRLNLGLVFLENDGIFAVANIRGGGEFGAKWYQGGIQDKKQNTFNDFQAGAESLIASNYTNSQKLAIYGTANGGLVVGVSIVQRPDLFKVALPSSAIFDMLRYHRFTIGAAWASDYGRSDDPIAFDHLLAYSPLHNVEEGQYPATMVLTAASDERIVSAHSFKFISELQANQKTDRPVLIRIEKERKQAKPAFIDEAIDILSFTFYNLNESIDY